MISEAKYSAEVETVPLPERAAEEKRFFCFRVTVEEGPEDVEQMYLACGYPRCEPP